MENEMANFDSFPLQGNTVTDSENKFDQFPLRHLKEKDTNFTISSVTEDYYAYYSFIEVIILSWISLLVLIYQYSTKFSKPSLKIVDMALSNFKCKNVVQSFCAFWHKEAQGAFSVFIIPHFLPYYCGKSSYHLLSPYTHGHCLIDHSSGGKLALIELTRQEKESLQNRKTILEDISHIKRNSTDVIVNIDDTNNLGTHLTSQDKFEHKNAGQIVTEQGNLQQNLQFTATPTSNQPQHPLEKAAGANDILPNGSTIKVEVNGNINEDLETRNCRVINDLEGKAPESPRLYSVGDSHKPKTEVNCYREWASSKLPHSGLNYGEPTSTCPELTSSLAKLQTKAGKVIIGHTKCIVGAGDTPAYFGGIAQIMHPSNHSTDHESSSGNFLHKDNNFKKFRTDARQWINGHMTPDTIDYLSNGNLSFEVYTKSLPVELDLSLLVGVLKDFNSTLQNAFDNFTCFFGKGDMAHFQRLYERAIQRSREVLQQSIIGEEVKIYESIISDACNQLILIYKLENKEITSFESDLLQEMYPEIINKYQSKWALLSNYGGKSVSRDIREQVLKNIHNRMVNSITKLINDSMNYDDKLNKVVSKVTEKIIPALNAMFDSFLISFHRNLELSRNQIENAIASYVTNVTEIPEGLTVGKIQSWHQSNVFKTAAPLEEGQRKEVLLRLYTYLMHLYEKMEYKNFIRLESENTVCIQISAGKIQYGFKAKRNGTREIVTLTQKSPEVRYITRSTSGTINILIMDKTSNFLRCSTSLENDTTFKLNGFFKTARSFLSMYTPIYQKQALLIVPTWTTMKQRHALHKAAAFSKFENAFIVNETSMAAYAFLKERANQKPGKAVIVLIFSIDKNGIQVEIYSLDKNDCLYLHGISYESWRDPIREDTSAFGGAQLHYYEPVPVNYKVKIDSAYYSAVDQLPGSIKNVKNYCLIAVDNFNGVDHMANFLSEQTRLCKLNDALEELAFKGAMMFIDNPQEIIKTILDYATFAQVAQIDNGPIEEKIIKSVKELDCDVVNCDKLVDKVDDDNNTIVKKKEKLIERCESAQSILKTTSCRLPMLVKRDIEKKVSDVRQVASLSETQLDELEQGNEIINSLVVKYPILQQRIT